MSETRTRSAEAPVRTSQSENYDDNPFLSDEERGKLKGIQKALENDEMFTAAEKAEAKRLRQELVEDVMNPKFPEVNTTETENKFGGPAQLPDANFENATVFNINDEGARTEAQKAKESVATSEVEVVPPTIYELNAELQNDPEIGKPYQAPALALKLKSPEVVAAREQARNDAINQAFAEETARYRKAQKIAETQESIDKLMDIQTSLTDVMGKSIAPAPETIPPIPEGVSTENEPTPIADQVAAELASQAQPRASRVDQWESRRQERARPPRAATERPATLSELRANFSTMSQPELAEMLAQMVHNRQGEAQRRAAGSASTGAESGKVNARDFLRDQGIDVDADHTSHRAGPRKRSPEHRAQQVAAAEAWRARQKEKAKKFGSGVLSIFGVFGSKARKARKQKKYEKKANKHRSKATKYEGKASAIGTDQAERDAQSAENIARREAVRQARANFAPHMAAQSRVAQENARQATSAANLENVPASTDSAATPETPAAAKRPADGESQSTSVGAPSSQAA